MPAKFDVYLFRFFVIWYTIGVFLLSFDLVPPWLEWANVVFLITSGLLAVVYFYRSGSKVNSIIAIIVIFFLSMAIESFGVHTGLFFGDYTYKTDFGPKVIGVPITIGFAWLMVMGTSHVLAAPIINVVSRFKALIYASYGAFIATSLDLIIDPVAYDAKQYWVWNEPGLYYNIPFSNFYGWFILSFVLHIVIYGLFFRSNQWINIRSVFWRNNMVKLYVMMAGMFIIIALVNKLWLASIVSLSTLCIIYLIYFKLRRMIAND
ncbi:carotenoid biosynthesis protein [Salipaludibacillus daqingensis]|uniref:carotenoid biosynthesis protein n=1 Tax=Salipaludibacillus daqingensis TaxID=3041001 RepID=UPI00247695E8|nr:carotenoid biosynthesis protein [Salipaludibacillus daqingensis]